VLNSMPVQVESLHVEFVTYKVEYDTFPTSRITSYFSCKYHSTSVLYSFNNLSPMPHSLTTWPPR